MQFSLRQLLIAVTCFCIVIAMYAHGNELLGVRTGILFASLTAATLFVLWRVFSKRRSFQLVRQVAAVLFASAALIFLAFPAWFSRDIADAVEWRRKQQIIRMQVHDVLLSDSRFSQLNDEYTFGAGAFVDDQPATIVISGQIKTELALLELRDQILEKCSQLHRAWLCWNVTIEGTKVRYSGYDDGSLNRPRTFPYAGFGLILLEQQVEAYVALNEASSLVIKQLAHRGIVKDRHVTVTDKAEVRQVICWLDFTPVAPFQGGEADLPCLIFRFDDERTVQVHVGDGKWWCFPGGPRRRLDPKMWEYFDRFPYVIGD